MVQFFPTIIVYAIMRKGVPLVVPMTVGGTLSAPKTSVNLAALAGTEVVKDAVNDGVKAGLNLIKGILNR